jgi:outer membrane biosynthesis protein TonB
MAETIEGAANKISGILNPTKDTQVPETKAEPSEPTPEKQEVQESQSESNETPEEQVTENTETTEETPTELETPELHRVKVSGQELEVSLDELKAGYSRDSDYRQKTHTLGMEKRDLETQKNSLRQTYDTRLSELNDLISTADQFVQQKQGGQDLAKLYQEDPTEAAKLDFQLRQEKQLQDKLRTNSMRITLKHKKN